MLLIPSIDLRGGQCVRLLRGDFAAETRYAETPAQLLDRYQSLGATWLHVVDLDGARDGVLANRELIAQLAAARKLRLQVGGGVRSEAVLDDLLALGVARAAVGSAAVEEPERVAGWLRWYGPECLCLALDVRLDVTGTPLLVTRGWQRGTQLPLWDMIGRYRDAGLRHVLCTDVERDGALAGPNLALYEEACRRYPDIAWQASGGVRDAADLAALRAAGLASAISGKALLEGRMSATELQPYLRAG